MYFLHIPIQDTTIIRGQNISSNLLVIVITARIEIHIQPQEAVVVPHVLFHINNNSDCLVN
jgi:hypothetical protein